MRHRTEQLRQGSVGFLRTAALAFTIGFSAHAVDHALRGLDSAPPRVFAVGTIQGAFVVTAVWMALTGRNRAPTWAMIVGFGSVLLFTYGHLLPVSLDSFVSAPHPSVSTFSWVTAAAEISTGIVFGLAGFSARRSHVRSTA